jgi:hypothetical protein
VDARHLDEVVMGVVKGGSCRIWLVKDGERVEMHQGDTIEFQDLVNEATLRRVTGELTVRAFVHVPLDHQHFLRLKAASRRHVRRIWLARHTGERLPRWVRFLRWSGQVAAAWRKAGRRKRATK